MVVVNRSLKPAKSGSVSEGWQPNPTWWDIEKILSEDTTEGYAYKTIYLITNSRSSFTAKDYVSSMTGNCSIRTSDGAFYENITNLDVTLHTWDVSKDKPCLIDGVEYYKTRYVILYFNDCVNWVRGYYETLMIIGDYLHTQLVISGNNYILEAIKINAPNLTSISGGNPNNPSRIKQIKFTTPPTNLTGFAVVGSLLEEFPDIDYSKITTGMNIFGYMPFIKRIKRLNLDSSAGSTYIFRCNNNLQFIDEISVPNATSLSNFIPGLSSLLKIGKLIGNEQTAIACNAICNAAPLLSEITECRLKATNLAQAFSYNYTLRKIGGNINMIECTNANGMFTFDYLLEEINLTNIRTSINLNPSDHLKIDCILNICKELHYDAHESTTATILTLSSGLSESLSNVYVKLIDITDDMRAEDEYIDLKVPFEVCESTDEGAMTIEEYVTSKNWTLSYS